MRLQAAVLVLLALAGCSRHQSPRWGALISSPPASACEHKLISTVDVAGTGMLVNPITVTPAPGDPQSCVFTADDKTVTISLRPGVGDDTVSRSVLSDGAEPVQSPMAKVAWKAQPPELLASSHNVLCDVKASAGNTSATQVALLILCQHIYLALD